MGDEQQHRNFLLARTMRFENHPADDDMSKIVEAIHWPESIRCSGRSRRSKGSKFLVTVLGRATTISVVVMGSHVGYGCLFGTPQTDLPHCACWLGVDPPILEDRSEIDMLPVVGGAVFH